MAIPTVADSQFGTLNPSLFSAGPIDPSAIADVRQTLLSVYRPLRESSVDPYNLARVASAVFYYRPALSRLGFTGKNKCALEIGSGSGMKAFSWGDLFGKYLGVELDTGSRQRATDLASRLDLRNVSFIGENAEAVVKNPERYDISQVDVLVLYAVLEHLTISEREAVIHLAHDVYQRGGAVLVGESSNRLFRFDSHSFELFFTETLPPELLWRYATRTKRDELKRKLTASSSQTFGDTLYRIGRGVSFHEFECFWSDDLEKEMRVVFDSYSMEILNLHPIFGDELDLLKYFVSNGIHAPRFFTRYWLEAVLSQATTRITGFPRYILPSATRSGPTRREKWHELDEVTLDKKNSLQFSPEHLSAAIMIDLSRSHGSFVATDEKNNIINRIDLAQVVPARLPQWHSEVSLPLSERTRASRQIILKADHSSTSILCQGVILA